METKTYLVSDTASFKRNALQYGIEKYEYVFCLESNSIPSLFGSFPQTIALGARKLYDSNLGHNFENLKQFIENIERPVFGFFSYDLKNEIEILDSNNPDYLEFPDLLFIEPEVLITFSDEKTVKIESSDFKVFERISAYKSIEKTDFKEVIDLKCKFTKEEYINIVKNIQKDIQRGEIYEMNLSIEYYTHSDSFNPLSFFFELNEISPMPFASFIKFKDKYVACASPERFLRKRGNMLISQPIKGTSKRGIDEKEDILLKELLVNSPKERAENIMIVDLVRNDLSIIAQDNSVEVRELCQLYSFSQVHQLISTITATLSPKVHVVDALKYCFPMGSMTGAPKIRAMEKIEKYEKSKRGLFSGAIGYIDPQNDFDFNVVIRSLFYNNTHGYLSFTVGSAITIESDPNEEWEECNTKSGAVRKALEKVFN